MRNRVVICLLVVLAFAVPSFAQKLPKADQPAEPGFEAGVETAAIRFDPKDLSGMWISVAEGPETIGPHMPPLTEEGKAKLATHISADRVDSPDKSNDPQFGCNPQGFPRLWFDREGIEILHFTSRTGSCSSPSGNILCGNSGWTAVPCPQRSSSRISAPRFTDTPSPGGRETR
jgi:hypothetical protein